ncbi:hypothetical protein [Nocardioides sp. YIM 152588]|uniref:hypothetical protein n=1 Tax=Nocardioides sp. YIM 152588 TaxID=3158259 RepID=UPI0032E46263
MTPAAATPETAERSAAGRRAPSTASRAARHRRRHLTPWLVWGTLALVAAAAFAWYADGGRWARVETPSMGTTAPVGALLWVKPTDFDSLRPGDFITFVPPGSDLTFSHAVEARNADGTIATRGELSPTDPWRLEAEDVRGRVVMVWKGAGWLALMGPALLAGAVAIAIVRRFVRAGARAPVTLLLGAALLALTISWYDPLVGAQQLAFTADDDGSATGTFVGTGLLPVEITADGGDRVRIGAGEVGTVEAVALGAGEQDEHRLEVRIAPVLAWWWWALIIAGCFSPAVVSAVRERAARHGAVAP